MTKNRRFWIFYTAIALTSIFGCNAPPENPGPQYGSSPVHGDVPVYNLAIHPLYNPTKLFSAYQPLVDYLNSHLEDAQITLEASRDYDTFEKKYVNRQPDFLLPNPWQTLQAMESGYQVIAMAGEPEDFKGIFIVRKDGPIEKPADLKGKAVSYPSPTALAACIMPQYFLHQNGVDVNRDIENRYVGSQESSIMNVYLGLTAAGATWPPPWRAFQRDHPQEAAELKVIWETEPLINNSVMARNDVPAGVRKKVQQLLITLHETEKGRDILAGMDTARFIFAEDSDYDIVRVFVAQFEKEVRPIEEQ
ncbi:MAG: phosphate/phosphite/phosphonate ABC transporter substrate-binding protein [Chloroflexi bacterium]|nr:phosphate/phosphite/phosphonate ABC transporter substrate-binding protein [Chloroflexota bacterium]